VDQVQALTQAARAPPYFFMVLPGADPGEGEPGIAPCEQREQLEHVVRCLEESVLPDEEHAIRPMRSHRQARCDEVRLGCRGRIHRDSIRFCAESRDEEVAACGAADNVAVRVTDGETVVPGRERTERLGSYAAQSRAAIGAERVDLGRYCCLDARFETV